MKKAALVTLLYFALCSFLAAQPWVYDFGTGTGSHTSGSSTTFLPQPSTNAGQDRVRVGDAGGGLYLENSGLASLGIDTELHVVAPTSGSVNKFSIYDYSSAKFFHTKFDILFGDSFGGNSATSGTFYFVQGNGSSFSGDGGYNFSESFTILRFMFDNAEGVNVGYRNNTTFALLGSNPISQGQVYHIEIWGNNSNYSYDYYRNGGTYPLGSGKQDIWVNGTRYANLAKAPIEINTVDSFMFYGETSIGNVANCFIDNIVYSNSFPVIPATQASNISSPDPSSNSIDLNWTNGNGDKRIVMVNTANSFTAPADGDDPVANPIYGSRGQQVIYNGTGTSVTVSGLQPETTYWFRIYEVLGSGLTTRYNTSSSATNPLSISTITETLPVEFSAFTAQVNSLGKIQLNWVTQSETNVHGFYVLRALDNLPGAAELVSPLIAATNTSTMQVYQFTDEAVWDTGTYYYWLQSLDLDGASILHGPVICNFNPGGQAHNPSVPLTSGFRSIYPNPFNPCTTIAYEISEAGDSQILIYNLKGQLVRAFSASHSQAGAYHLTWDGLSDKGEACASGVYSIVLVENDKCHVRKAVLMK